MLIPFRRKLRIQFLKWHRRIGLAAAVFAVVLVVTGIALNHGNELGLDHSPAPRQILSLYGIEIPKAEEGYKAADAWLAEVNNGLYLNGSLMGECYSPLIGAISVDDLILVACSNNIYLLTPDGQIVEKDSMSIGVIKRMGKHQESIIFAVDAKSYRFDPDEFSWEQNPETFELVGTEWSNLEKLPTEVSTAISDNLVITEITWERLMLDLHSGRLFGSLGVWVMDLAGIAILLLALSGVWLRIARPTRR